MIIMDKYVRVTVTGPIPIIISTGSLTHGTHGPMMMNENDLFRCIAGGAMVCEVVAPMVQVPLTFANYQSDNSIGKAAPPVPDTVDNSSINNGPVVKSIPVTIDRSLPVAESVEEEVVMIEEIQPVEPEEEKPVEATPIENESPRHWQAPPKEKRNKRR